MTLRASVSTKGGSVAPSQLACPLLVLAGGTQPLGIYLPESLNAWTGLFIAWCGLHMLLFNTAQLVMICGNFEAHTTGSLRSPRSHPEA